MRNILLGLVSSTLLACAACSVSTEPSSADDSSTQSSTKARSLEGEMVAQYTQNEHQAAPVLTISIGQQPMTCAGAPPVGATYLDLSLPQASVAPGTFTVGYDGAPSTIYVARLTSAGAHSAVSAVEEGASGTVTLTQAFLPTDDLTTATVVGSYDITFPEGRMTGQILSGACASELNQIVPAAASN